MALRQIVTEGDDILRKKARMVPEVDDKIRSILDDMLETMRAEAGVGIAAPQVGILKRMFIVETEDQFIELINPEIIKMEGSQLEEEGCLSVPGVAGTVERPEFVKIKGLNREGEEVVYEGFGLAAIAICHENDHLDGILFVDKATDRRFLDEEE